MRLDMQNSSQERRRNSAPGGLAQQRTATTQTPRRPKGAGGGEEQAVRLAGRDHHTRSVGGKSPAQSAQWCCSIGRRRIISGSAEILAMSAMRLDDRAPARETRLRSRHYPELRLPTAAAQTRIVSGARIRLDLRKSARPFKGIIFPDVSEFESYMPSHAVGSLLPMSRVLPGIAGTLGNAAHDYKRSGIAFQPSKRGAQGRPGPPRRRPAPY